MEKLHELNIIGEVVCLDSFELKGIKEYRIDHPAAECPSITVTVYIKDTVLQSKSLHNDGGSDLAK